jgi:undecaprenyl-diphosphatase
MSSQYDHDLGRLSVRAWTNAEEKIGGERVPPPQLARRGRRFIHVYIAVLLVAMAVFAVLGFYARSGNALLAIDVPVTHAVQGVRLPLYGWVLTHISDLGFTPGDVISYVIVLAGLAAAGLRAEAVLAVVSALLASLVGSGIKLLVGRLRPAGHGVHVAGHVTGYSFPSGHVTQYMTLFGFTFFLVFVTWRGGWLRTIVLVILAVLVVLVGPSRVYMGQHWPSDVLGAYLFAGVWLAGTIELDLFLPRRSAWWKRHAGSGRARNIRTRDAQAVTGSILVGSRGDPDS